MASWLAGCCAQRDFAWSRAVVQFERNMQYFACVSPGLATCRRDFAMAENKTNVAASETVSGFRISEGPVVHFARGKGSSDLDAAVELPRVYGEPILFAIARDPRVIFACWNIDWPSIFASASPVDRQVHLRVYKNDGAQETSAAAEPMAGSCCLAVSEPSGVYRVEIGYYHPEAVWNSVATSDAVAMPPDRVSENVDVDLATIPFHLSFQRLIDLFRASNSDALTEIISRLQKRTLTGAERELLTPEEWEILRAMNLSLDEIGAARRAVMDGVGSPKLRKRAEAILGFGSTSPSHGFGQSSWNSAAS